MKKFLFTALFATIGVLSFAQTRGGDLEMAVGPNVTVGKQWAVFIAIDEYPHLNEPPLKYPVKDAQDVRDILLRHYYIDEVRELYNSNATVANVRRLFLELLEKTEPNDSVFVFHAGHGVNEDRTGTPAWILHDGVADILEQKGWLDHRQIRSMLDSLKAKHVFLISDSCYSGVLLDARRVVNRNIDITKVPVIFNRKSRQAMSSGGNEEVDDVSEFASRLKNILRRTEAPFITPEFLLAQIIGVETMRPLRTTPQLAAIPLSSHEEGGSFLFFRKNPTQPPIQEVVTEIVTPPAAETTTAPSGEQGVQDELGFFVGSWVTTVEHNNSLDTYEITLSANGRCTVKIINDTAQQEATGRWSWDGSIFRLNATFRNPAITYQRNIQWTSRVSYSGNNSFNILARPAANSPIVMFTFFRE